MEKRLRKAVAEVKRSLAELLDAVQALKGGQPAGSAGKPRKRRV